MILDGLSPHLLAGCRGPRWDPKAQEDGGATRKEAALLNDFMKQSRASLLLDMSDYE